MRLRFIHFLFYSLFLLVFMKAPYAHEFKRISRLSQVSDPDLDGTIVVLDLDETLIEPVGFLGSKIWYYEYFNHVRQQTQSPEGKSHAIAMRVWNRVQSHLQMKLVDPSAIEWIQKRQQRRTPVIALTARRPELRRVTMEQLERLGLFFHPLYKLSSIESGVHFVGEFKPKGEALLQLIQENSINVKRVIFVDDSINNQVSVSESLSTIQVIVDSYVLEPECQKDLEGKDQ